jgi:Family of unknown function (DUF6441)
MKLVFSAQEGALERLLEDIARQIDEAKAGAVQDAAALAVREGRANIASAGFSRRWQAALDSKFFPNKDTGNPAALIFDRIPFAGVFERGARIGGHPLLWLPIEKNLPAGIHSPRAYGGRLVSVNVAGKPPLLFDAGKRELGPLFVGVSQVNIRKRFDLYRIFARAADRLQEFYEKRIKD